VTSGITLTLHIVAVLVIFKIAVEYFTHNMQIYTSRSLLQWLVSYAVKPKAKYTIRATTIFFLYYTSYITKQNSRILLTLNGNILLSTSELHTTSMLFLSIAVNLKLHIWDYLRWRGIHAKFFEIPSHGPNFIRRDRRMEIITKMAVFSVVVPCSLALQPRRQPS
jgi:hypothetical protein